MVSCFVFFACKCYCSILLLQTLFYLFSPPPQHTTMAPCNGTQQWHHVRSPKVGRRPPIAHYNGTLQWHPAMAPRPLPQSWSSPSPSTIVRYNDTLRWHPAMAPSNGTTSTAPCNGTLVPRPIRQSGSSPPLPEVRTPIAIVIWGKRDENLNSRLVDLSALDPSSFFSSLSMCFGCPGFHLKYKALKTEIQTFRLDRLRLRFLLRPLRWFGQLLFTCCREMRSYF